MSAISLNVMAQTADDAVKAIKNNAPDKEQVVKAATKAHKKDPAGLVKIGRAYLQVDDIVNCEKYANLADAASKHKSAAAFILMGDLAVNQDNGGKAAEMYQQATYAEPSDPTGYIKYANIFRGKSPDTAVEMLNEMRKNCPNEPVDAYAAHIYYLSATTNAAYMPKALEFYKKADLNKLDKNQMIEFALTAFVSQENELSKQIAVSGLQKNPRYAGFNRLALYNSVELKQYDEATKYVDALFNKSDSVDLSANDYKFAALAYTGAEKHNEALAMRLKQKDAAEGAEAKALVMKDISDTYRALGEMDLALQAYDEFIKTNPNTSANDYAGYANIYRNLSATEGISDADKEGYIYKAIDVYKSVVEKFPTSADYSNFMAARTIQAIDADQKKGLAVPYYQALYESISAAGIKEKSDKTRIMEACQYLGIYYFKIKDDNATAKPYFLKLQEIDPENALAKQVLEILD